MKYLFFLIICGISIIESFNPFANIKSIVQNKVSEIKKKNFISVYDQNILEKLKTFSDQKYTIIDRKNNYLYDNFTSLLRYNPKLRNKETISISPGGIQGFYLMGVIDFIKHNYNMYNYIYTGASAGAWSSLFMSFRGDGKQLINDILFELENQNIKSVFEMQLYLKQLLLRKYDKYDFNLSKIFIGVTVLKKLDISTNIFFNFNSLEDAIDCCIASSHIPFLTGGLVNKYNNAISFDGGFSNAPYLDINNTILHINPNIWSKQSHTIINFEDLIADLNEINYYSLYVKGFTDTKNNKSKLDKIFYV